MTDQPERTDPGVAPPDEDEMFEDDGPDEVEQTVQQANQFHQMMDGAKDWARQTASELRVKAALADDPETAEELERIVLLIESVTARIEHGDNNRARQP